MYKALIIGIALMVTCGSGYYIIKSGGGEMIANALTNDTPPNAEPPTIEGVTGVYICDTGSGCTKRYVLVLKEDQTLEMSSLADVVENADSDKGEESADSEKPIERNSIIVNTTEAPALDITLDASTSSTDTLTTTSSTQDVLQSNNDTEVSIISSDTTITEQSASLAVLEELNSVPLSTIEKGNWTIGVQNMLVINLLEVGTTTYNVPQKLVVKNVGASTLSKISYTKANYKNMIKPVFVKQD